MVPFWCGYSGIVATIEVCGWRAWNVCARRSKAFLNQSVNGACAVHWPDRIARRFGHFPVAPLPSVGQRWRRSVSPPAFHDRCKAFSISWSSETCGWHYSPPDCGRTNEGDRLPQIRLSRGPQAEGDPETRAADHLREGKMALQLGLLLSLRSNRSEQLRQNGERHRRDHREQHGQCPLDSNAPQRHHQHHAADRRHHQRGEPEH